MVQTAEDKLFLEQKLISQIPQPNHNIIFYSSPKIWGEITLWQAHKKSLTNIHFMNIIELQYPHFQISELPLKLKKLRLYVPRNPSGELQHHSNPTADSSHISLSRCGTLLTNMASHNISVEKYLYGFIL